MVVLAGRQAASGWRLTAAHRATLALASAGALFCPLSRSDARRISRGGGTAPALQGHTPPRPARRPPFEVLTAPPRAGLFFVRTIA